MSHATGFAIGEIQHNEWTFSASLLNAETLPASPYVSFASGFPLSRNLTPQPTLKVAANPTIRRLSFYLQPTYSPLTLFDMSQYGPSNQKIPRSGVFAIMIFLFLAASYYGIVPFYSPAVDSISSSITSRLQLSFSSPSFCTKDIGDGLCCELHLGAEPCLTECRSAFVDRETVQLTKEYEECSDRCLIMYNDTCGKNDGTPNRTPDKRDIVDIVDKKLRQARHRRQPRP
ncbi:hypothetical protein CC78DRAFT_605229 [Lojkania enalia]|uniref:Uncharacterized protein n=1 Tax=Lojkania enalia TaxID=147567 RepID=A0A9P4K6R0_9PLEO|nr:hypothetical protein CC78DRAFT_605229 [Didymosphaeria enalia]